MCILFIAKNRHPVYPLIVAANRDEYFSRPSRSMHWWKDRSDLFAGRDMTAGGTWLGINTHGSFAAVTNLRTDQPNRSDARSRGELTVRCLEKESDPETIQGFLQECQHKYNPFNLVFGSSSELFAWGYNDHGPRLLEDGFHSISNGPLTSIWPKMNRGVTALTKYINTHPIIEPDTLLPMMLDTSPAPDDELPDNGLGLERERLLSSIFVQGTVYGTRTTSILLFSRSLIKVAEFEHDPGKQVTSSSRHDIAFHDSD